VLSASALGTSKPPSRPTFVNISNAMMMKAPVREILPMGPQKVWVKLQDGAKWRQSGGRIEATTPPIALHEVIGIDI
jgi:hypothetical protein